MINLKRTYPEGTELTDGFHLIMDALEANGIENLYGLLGIPVTELGRMWQARGHKFYSFRNEQNAGYAASVAGYLTGKPGVCVTVSAPGFLNGLTALANATTNCFPMILISGSSEREIVDLQQGDYEEMDQLAIARPHCKAAYRVNRPEDIGVAFARSCRCFWPSWRCLPGYSCCYFPGYPVRGRRQGVHVCADRSGAGSTAWS